MKITTTRDYSRFVSSSTNRVITEKDKTRLRKLRDSMSEYGFLPFPILVRRSGEKLTVIDGQHRLAIAQELKLPLMYVETTRDNINIAKCAAAQSPWSIFDFVSSHAARGNKQYEELLRFAKEYKMQLSAASTILAGEVAHGGNQNDKIKAGTFVIKDREFAHKVASLASEIWSHVEYSPSKNALAAISRLIRVPEFEPSRLVKKMQTFPGLYKNQATVDAFTSMFEEIYNYGAHKRIPLAFLANEAAATRRVAPRQKPRVGQAA